ncbi:MAG: CoA transferase [Actinomycetota bacterium]
MSDFTPLRGIRVLELGDGVAGRAATATLASLGASVRTVVDNGPRSLGAEVADRDKTLVTTDTAPAFSDVDIVVADRVEHADADVAAHVAAVEASGAKVWVTITAYGLVGPRRDEFGDETSIAAAGGLLTVVRSPDTGRPVLPGGSQALQSTGQVAALAALHGLALARERGRAHVDVSAQAATLATGPNLQVIGKLLNSTALGGARRYGAPAAFYPCRDGIIRISALEDHQWQGVIRAFDRPEWNDRYPETSDRLDHAEEIDGLVEAITSGMDKVRCEAQLQREGVPAAALYGPAELLASVQLEDRGVFTRVPLRAGGEATVVGAAHRLAGGSSPSAADRRGLTGLRVAEVGHVLAAPIAGSLLGAMGADVVKVEDSGRIDMFRRRLPFIDDEAGNDRAVYFAMANHSKRSTAFAFTEEPDTLHRVLDRCDVVVENLGPSHARKIEVDAPTVAARRDGVLAVSSSGYGLDGPTAHFRAYAYNLHTACGLAATTVGESGEPARVDMAWADVITGFAIATVVAAWAEGSSGGAAVDLSMAEVVAGRFNEFLAAQSLGRPWEPSGPIDIETPSPEGLVADEQLNAFGIYREVDHPLWGRRSLIGVPWRFVDGPDIALAPPPLFGDAAPSQVWGPS